MSKNTLLKTHNIPLTWNQYHPNLRHMWEQQITTYKPNQDNINLTTKDNAIIYENFIEWDDPYRFIRPWTIIDFLRNFKLTK